MGKLFPESIGSRILSTKQDVFFFGPPPGDSRFDDQHLPVWADHRGRFMYGIPATRSRIQDRRRYPRPEFDPTTGERW